MRTFREVVYFLKQRYGTPIDIYNESVPILDPQTGKNSITRVKQHINKAIIYSSDIKHLLASMPLSPNFSRFQGIFDSDIINVIIDPHDMNGYTPQLMDYIDYNGDRYDVAQINIIQQRGRVYSYFLTAKEAKTSQLYRQIDLQWTDTLVFAQTFQNG